MKILNTFVSVFLAISVLIISAFLILALVLQFKWWSFLAVPLGITTGVVFIVLGSMADDYLKYVIRTRKRRGYFEHVRNKPDYIREAEKIPDNCIYLRNSTCGFGEIEPYDMCPKICPRYKGDSV